MMKNETIYKNECVLLSERMAANFHDILVELGIEVISSENDNYAGILTEISKATILVIRSKTKLNPTLLKKAKHLELIIRAGAGIEHVDLGLLQQQKIEFRSTPGENSQSVGEHAVGTLIALLKYFPRTNTQLKSMIWKRLENTGREVQNLTIGIIGYGYTGMAFAKCLSGFGAKILAYDKYKSNFTDHLVEEVNLNEIKSRCNVISFHVPYTEETHYYFDSAFLRSVKNNIILINTSRGKVTDLKAIIAGLSSGKITGVGLDVFENENWNQLSSEFENQLKKLFTFDNIILSPHTAGVTHESNLRIQKAVLNHIKIYLENKYGVKHS